MDKPQLEWLKAQMIHLHKGWMNADANMWWLMGRLVGYKLAAIRLKATARRLAERVGELEAENLRLQGDADSAHMAAQQRHEEATRAASAIRSLCNRARSAQEQLDSFNAAIREGLAANAIAERDLKPEEWWLYAQKDDQGIDLEGDFFVVLGPWNGKELPVRFPDLGNGFGLRRNLTEDELRKHAPDALARASVHKTHQQEAARHAARAGA